MKTKLLFAAYLLTISYLKKWYSLYVSLLINLSFALFLVVQRMDNVTEGMQNYGGKINAVETDLKKLGKTVLGIR